MKNCAMSIVICARVCIFHQNSCSTSRIIISTVDSNWAYGLHLQVQGWWKSSLVV